MGEYRCLPTTVVFYRLLKELKMNVHSKEECFKKFSVSGLIQFSISSISASTSGAEETNPCEFKVIVVYVVFQVSH